MHMLVLVLSYICVALLFLIYIFFIEKRHIIIIKRKEADIYKKNNLIHIYDMWIAALQKGNSVSGWLQKKGYERIAIYGMGELGVRLWSVLRNSKAEVEYGIDRNKHLYVEGIPVYSINEVSNQNIDVVIVTALISYDSVRKQLLDEGFQNVIALDEILCELLTGEN